MPPQEPDSSQGRPAGYFATTRWTVVLAAGADHSVDAQDALAKLCQTYWYPLYAYVRQRGCSTHDAQDLTQAFFERLLEKNTLAQITRERGKFRSFLLTALNHFLVDEWKKARAQRRGGGRVISLDSTAAETRYAREPAETCTPEKLFEQNWALALLDSVFEQLRLEYEKTGKARLFTEIKFCLTGEKNSVPYELLAERLGLPVNTLKVAVHRLRQRYRELLRAEVANTVTSPEEVEEELRYLFRALAS